MKKCRGCGEGFYQYNTIQKYCVKCAIKKGNEKKAKQNKKDQDTQIKGWIEELKDYKKILESNFNKLIRKIDGDLPCISCGRKGKKQAGHYHSVGSHPNIRYNAHNVHVQDYYCNVQLSSNREGYRAGLAERYNGEYAAYVDGLKGKAELRATRDELKEANKKVLKMLKTLDKQGIEARDYINQQIGFYGTYKD